MIRKLLITLVVGIYSSHAASQEVGSQSKGSDVKEATERTVDNSVKALSGISIIGNKEAPKSLYIVPWKNSEVGVETDLASKLMDTSLAPLDKAVFIRELEFYQISGR